MYVARDSEGGGTGSARRRRERRLRMHWHHEQLTLKMALAAAIHHSCDVGPELYNALRSQTTARARGEEYALNYTAKIRKTPPPAAAATEFYPLTPDEGGGLAAGRRPLALAEPRPQGQVEQHGGLGYELVLALEAPALQMMEEKAVEQVQAYLRALHAHAGGLSVVGAPFAPAAAQEQVIVCDIPGVLSSSLHVIPGVLPAFHVQEQVIDHEIPDDYGVSRLQEQVLVHDIPEVQAVSLVQEQVLAPGIPEVQAVAHVQEQVNVHEIPEVGAVYGFPRVQQRTVEHAVSHVRAGRGTASSPGVPLNPGECAGYGVFSHFFPTTKKCEGQRAVDAHAGCSSAAQA